ncbi:unnamed protein product [Prorocentrum cordatum]|uniref:VWFA domain-containing protein n=1 Tax=Prorocentrum cordatum TaxID=2364126 RepID=A0ABN9XQE3_9DINO|nr:unnamed protein product [Polarella glacialis]
MSEQVRLSIAPGKELQAAGGEHVPIMVSVAPPDGAQRCPVDICCVVDVSGSMGTEAMLKGEDGSEVGHGLSVLDIVKHALKTIIHNLGDTDRLALVAYSNDAQIIFNLTVMTPNGRSETERRLDELSPSGMTNLWDGLKTGMDVLSQGAGQGERLQHVMLFTDGLPNINPPRGILPMLKRLKDKGGGKLPCAINTFGFGYELDSELLSQLAADGSGAYAFIPDPGFVGTVFVNSMANLLVTMGKDVVLTLEPTEGATIGFVAGGHPVTKKPDGSIAVGLGSLQFGQAKEVIVSMTVPQQAVAAGFLKASLAYGTRSQNEQVVSCVGRGSGAAGTSRAVEMSRVRLKFVDTVRAAMQAVKLSAADKAKVPASGGHAQALLRMEHYNADRESTNGCFSREVLEEHHLCAPNTLYECTPAYYHGGILAAAAAARLHGGRRGGGAVFCEESSSVTPMGDGIARYSARQLEGALAPGRAAAALFRDGARELKGARAPAAKGLPGGRLAGRLGWTGGDMSSASTRDASSFSARDSYDCAKLIFNFLIIASVNWQAVCTLQFSLKVAGPIRVAMKIAYDKVDDCAISDPVLESKILQLFISSKEKVRGLLATLSSRGKGRLAQGNEVYGAKDVGVFEDLPRLTWLAVAAQSGYALHEGDAHFVLALVAAAATHPRRTAPPDAVPEARARAALHRLLSGPAVGAGTAPAAGAGAAVAEQLSLCLTLRACYGGMGCDIDMLLAFAGNPAHWEHRVVPAELTATAGAGLADEWLAHLRSCRWRWGGPLAAEAGERLEAAVDFHCSDVVPRICRYLQGPEVARGTGRPMKTR